jgi:hypothetical protein
LPPYPLFHPFPEAAFLDVIGTKVLRVFSLLFTINCYTNGFNSPPPCSKSGLKLVCNVNIVYGNLKSVNSQDYAQKPQRNSTFMNSASVLFYPFAVIQIHSGSVFQ